MLVTTIILFGFGYYNYHTRSVSAFRELSDNAQRVVERLAKSTTLAIWNMDTKQVQEALLSEMGEKQVQSLVIREPDGVNIFAAKGRDSSWNPVDITETTVDYQAVFAKASVEHHGQLIGVVEVSITRKYAQGELWQMLWASAISTLIVDVAVVFILFLVITMLVIKPLAAMQRYAQAVGSGDLACQEMTGIFVGELGALKSHLEDMVRSLSANIEQLRQKSLEATESRERYRSVIQNMQDVYYRTDAEGRLVMVSPSGLKLFGYESEDQVLGQFTESFYAIPAERQQLLAKVQADGAVREYEVLLKRKDGSAVQAATTASFYRDEAGNILGVEGVFRDITERKQAEERLRQSEAHIRALFNATSDSAILMDCRGVILAINEHGAKRRNLLPEDMTGHSIYDFLPPDSANLRRHQTMEAVRTRGPVTYEEFRNEASYSVTIYPILDSEGTPRQLASFSRDVTEKKRAEEELHEAQDALKRSEEIYRTLFMNTGTATIVIEEDTTIALANPEWEKLVGLPREEMEGRMSWTVFFSPENLKRMRGYHMRRRESPELAPRNYESELIDSKGGHHNVQLTVAMIPGTKTSVAALYDITEQKRAVEELRQSEEKFSRIFEMAPECISFIRLKDSVVIAANAAFETITGHKQEEAIGRAATEMGVWDAPGMHKEFMQRLMAEGHVKDFEFLLRRKDGELRRVVNSAQLVAIAGEECFISVIHDITDERKMQELLIQSEKMMSVGSLAAGIAHEINNPLGIVHQAVQNLILRTSPEQKKNLETAASLGLSMDLLQQYLKARKLDVFLEDIKVAAMRASGIIRNMLNFSRRSESKRQTCGLHHIIEQSVFLAASDYDLRKSYDFKRIEIVLDLKADLPACNCTETEIEQVLLNLLRNSAQAMAMATPPTPNPRIDIRLRAGEKCVRLEVTDNGPGMDEETQRKALEPFFTTKPPGVGTGLGLSVSYFIITKGHGGRMWMTSAPGRGTTFFIELPAAQQEDAHA
ncbi:MAG: hypothetical protein A2051_09240 [Desulfovibrionales bacterium GWA2_65_9]|nr:MAG: hypothetical protein A2051_09240 [Desulfovibrionales bacterium GWA2_65_9]